MINVNNLFNKGEKVFTVSDADNEFKILEVEIYGFAYQDFEGEGKERILYVFDLDGQRKFGSEDIMFRNKEEALEKLRALIPEYKKNIDAEIAQMDENKVKLGEIATKLIESANKLLGE